MDEGQKKNLYIAGAVLLVLIIIWYVYKNQTTSGFDPNMFNFFDGPATVDKTPTYITTMNPYGTIDDPLTTAANEGLQYSRVGNYDPAKYEGTNVTSLRFDNAMVNTEDVTEDGVYYDIAGGFLPPVDIAGYITSMSDLMPSTTNKPAPDIIAPTPTQAIVTGTSGSAATPLSVGSAPLAATLSSGPAAITQPAPTASNFRGRVSYF